MAGFDRFEKVWATNGLLQDPSDAQANQGWLYIGQAPPTVEQFNSTHRWWDEKDNWLWGQIKNVILDAQLTPVANDLTTLLQALNRKLAAYVLKIGDTMTGTLLMANGPNGITWAPPGALPYGTWGASKMGFGWDGSRLRVKVDGTDVGWIALNYVPGNFVLKTGDTMTGTLVNQQTVQANYLLSMGDILATRNLTGAYIHSTGSMNVDVNLTSHWIHSTTDVIADGSVHGNYVHSYGNVRADNYLDGANLTVAGNTQLHYTNIASNLDVSGNVTCANLTASTNVQAGYVLATGFMETYGSFWCDGGRIMSRSPGSGHSPSVSAFDTASNVCFGFWGDINGMHFGRCDQNGAPGVGGEYGVWDLSQNLYVYGYVTAYGHLVGSDSKIKENIIEVGQKTDSLSALSNLQLIAYDHKHTKEHHELGFSTDNIEDVLPGLIREASGPEDETFATFDMVGMLAHCCNAIRQLNDKLNEKDRP